MSSPILLSVTQNDLQNAGMNGLYCAGHQLLGFTIAYVINKLVFELIPTEANSLFSKIRRAAAYSTGVYASYYLLNRTPLVSFAEKKMFEVQVVGTVALLFLRIFFPDKLDVSLFVPVAGGALAGWVGKPAVLLSGAIGAFAGIAATDREKKVKVISGEN